LEELLEDEEEKGNLFEEENVILGAKNRSNKSK